MKQRKNCLFCLWNKLCKLLYIKQQTVPNNWPHYCGNNPKPNFTPMESIQGMKQYLQTFTN